MYSAIMEVPHYWTADQVGRLLDALAAHNRHQARTAVLIMWRTGLRVGGLGRGIPRYWEAARWYPFPAAQCCQALADGREGSAERGLAMAWPRECLGNAPDLPAHRGQRLRHGCCAVERGSSHGAGGRMVSFPHELHVGPKSLS